MLGLYLPPLTPNASTNSRNRRVSITEIFLRHGERCWWCRRRVRLLPNRLGEPQEPDQATRDHYVTRFHGGNGEGSNLVLACYECNNERSNMPVSKWMLVMRDRGYPPQSYAALQQCRVEGRRWPHVPLPQPPARGSSQGALPQDPSEA